MASSIVNLVDRLEDIMPNNANAMEHKENVRAKMQQALASILTEREMEIYQIISTAVSEKDDAMHRMHQSYTAIARGVTPYLSAAEFVIVSAQIAAMYLEGLNGDKEEEARALVEMPETFNSIFKASRIINVIVDEEYPDDDDIDDTDLGPSQNAPTTLTKH